MSAWDDPDWFRDEREANPPDWIDARKVPRSEVLGLFGLTEDGEPTPARKAWQAAETARLTREMAERGYRYVPDPVTVPVSYLRCAACGKRLDDYGDCDACASSHAEHVATGGSDRDCRDCERAWETWNMAGAL